MSYLDHVKEKVAGKQICIYPMGIAAKSLLNKLKKYEIKIDYFCDKNSQLWGGKYQGVSCISQKQLIELNQEDLVVIVESLYYKEIKKDLEELGIRNILRVYPEKFVIEEYIRVHKKDDIQERVQAIINICADEQSKRVYRYLTDSWWKENCGDNYFEEIYSQNQYFDNDIVKISDDEVFVDGGAYIGDSAEKFLHFCNGKYEKMHLFELDQAIYKKLKENMNKISKEKIVCYPVGLGSENAVVNYYSGDSNSSISDWADEWDTTGEIRKLDDILKNEKVTFIKMDIEGAETDALKGCENIIKSQNPTLAICIYHSPEDMLNIPLMIKQMVPEYQIYIRHYTDMLLETVCYAIKR